MGGYFSSVGLEIIMDVHLREVSSYGRLKILSFHREVAGTAVWFLLIPGARLREVPVSGGLTVSSIVPTWAIDKNRCRKTNR